MERSAMGILSALRAHRRHPPQHSAASLARLGAACALLALAACSDAAQIHPLDSVAQIDWSGEFQRVNQPGLLGALIDRPPPAVTIRASGPYPGPLSDSASPLLTPAMAEAVVAEPLRGALSPEARMSLARASILAAAAATGTAVAWKAADTGGTVTPARDIYLSGHGLACRDLRQALEKPETTEIEPVTLCRAHTGDDRARWEPEQAD